MHKDSSINFTYHGSLRLSHHLTPSLTNHRNLHGRVYKEKGTVMTSFDTLLLIDLDNFHLLEDVIPTRCQVCGWVMRSYV
ncbi:hypothetical protein [Methylophaga sp.]|uniref:phosphoketolase family protein n=1 Tax=Methylophaga sp. TaxID=2024840 RepID=UPI0039AEAB62